METLAADFDGFQLGKILEAELFGPVKAEGTVLVAHTLRHDFPKN